MVDPITIEVPRTPSRYISPNSRSGSRQGSIVRRKEKDVHRSAAYKAASELRFLVPDDWRGRPLEVAIDVRWERGRRRRDGDNMLASLKSQIDGIASGLGIDDALFVFPPVEQIVTGEGVVRYTIEPWSVERRKQRE